MMVISSLQLPSRGQTRDPKVLGVICLKDEKGVVRVIEWV